jgi:hypothetical protein
LIWHSGALRLRFSSHCLLHLQQTSSPGEQKRTAAELQRAPVREHMALARQQRF